MQCVKVRQNQKQIGEPQILQKKRTDKRICFVCFFAFHSKQNKSVGSFLTRIYGVPILLLVLSGLYLGKIYCRDFTKICGLLRIYELYLEISISSSSSRNFQVLNRQNKLIETISIFWSLIYQNLVLIVIKFWKFRYLVIIKMVLIR